MKWGKHQIMKSKLKSLFFVLMVGLFLAQNFWAQQLELVTAEGIAAILQEDKALARDRALDDALRKAVEQTVGTIIDAETLVSNYQVLNDSIYSQSKGYVQSYVVVSEQVNEDLYKVVVEAVVSMDYLQEDLKGIAALLRRVHKPRLLVRIEFNAPGWESTAGKFNPAESKIIDVFKQKGFDLVDTSAVATALGQPDESIRQIFESDQAAAIWGKGQGAEILIVGQGVVNKTKLPILGTMSSYQSILSLSAIKIDTGAVMAAGTEQQAAVHIDDAIGSKQSIEKAADILGTQLLDKIKKIFNQEVSEGTTIQLVVTGMNDQQLVDFKNVLGQQVRGVQPGGIHQRYFANGLAKLDVQVKGNAQFLADELTRKDFQTFKLSLIQYSQNKLDLKFIPKGSLPEIQ